MKRKKTNLQLLDLVKSLGKASKMNKAPIWRAISRSLSKPRKNMAQVNLSRISHFTKSGQTIAVPGKVLGSGVLNHKVIVAALTFSASAEEKIKAAGGTCITFNQLIETNPKGTEVKIMR